MPPTDKPKNIECWYHGCQREARLLKKEVLIPRNFLCEFHQMDECAVESVLGTEMWKRLWRLWGFATPSETEGSVLSSRV